MDPIKSDPIGRHLKVYLDTVPAARSSFLTVVVGNGRDAPPGGRVVVRRPISGDLGSLALPIVLRILSEHLAAAADELYARLP